VRIVYIILCFEFALYVCTCYLVPVASCETDLVSDKCMQCNDQAAVAGATSNLLLQQQHSAEEIDHQPTVSEQADTGDAVVSENQEPGSMTLGSAEPECIMAETQVQQGSAGDGVNMTTDNNVEDEQNSDDDNNTEHSGTTTTTMTMPAKQPR